MRNILIGILIGVVIATVYSVYAMTPSGTDRAKPFQLYGTESGGTLTAIQVDSDGKGLITTS